MERWGGMLRVLLSVPGWRGGTGGWAFSSWRHHLPPAGLSATELVNKWTAVFEKEGIPEARESISEPEASTVEAAPDPCATPVHPGTEWPPTAKSSGHSGHFP
ncbi:HemK methyltransferase family member 1 [Phyllostomus discolor]|uniref:HemK methyltransferase family member 1 n=1 Tax=Phyllostomus discolor TaxID=89673 RepID=A0A833ZVC5_9CHIR|nr:HemK methyltransferase family member 1 [Phyllostomus discolor]